MPGSVIGKIIAGSIASVSLTGILLTGLLVAAPSAHAGLYQWKDENGRVHFGDRPPESLNATEMAMEETTPSQSFQLNIKRQEFELSDDAMARVKSGIAQIHNTYRKTFGLDVRGTTEVNLYLIQTSDDYYAWYRERTSNGKVTPSRGVFIPKTNEVAVWAHGEEDAIVATILHESSHVIIFQMAPYAPAWIHEGFAQYFQTLRLLADGDLQVTVDDNVKNLIHEWRREGKLISVRQYLGITDRQFRELAHQRSAVPYTLAWGLVNFLMSDTTGQQTVRRILHDLEKSDERPTIDSLDRRYPGGLPQLEYAFFKWAQGDMPPQRLKGLQ